MSATFDLIARLVNEALADAGAPVVDVTPTTNLLRDTGLDSMALAVIVVQLEEELGKDPFAQGFIEFRTAGELAALYDAC